jgi:glutathione S-transferase
MSLKILIADKNVSSWSMRPWLALVASGAPFTEEILPIYVGDAKPLLAARTPAGKVPVLIDGDLAIHESLAICEHLAERFPDAGLWPADLPTRSLARAAATEMHAGFASLRNEMSMDLARREKKEPSPAVAADIARLVSIFRTHRTAHAASGPYLFGRWSIADAMYTPVATRFRSYGVTIDDPVAREYCAALLAHPAFLRWEEDSKR